MCMLRENKEHGTKQQKYLAKWEMNIYQIISTSKVRPNLSILKEDLFKNKNKRENWTTKCMKK